MSTEYMANPAYAEYEQLLLQLHELMTAGKSETDEADEIRDAMDAPWWKLSQGEQDSLGGISGDLYQIQGSEVFRVLSDPAEVEQANQRLQAAIRRQDWPEVLQALRSRSRDASDAEVARVRATAYHRLGYLQLAEVFALYALEREPRNSMARFLALELQAENGHDRASLEMGATWSDVSKDDLLWLVRYVSILMAFGEGDAPQSYWLSTAERLSRALSSVSEAEVQAGDLVFYARAALTICLVAQNDVEAARQWLQRAEAIAPGHSDARELLDRLSDVLRPGTSELMSQLHRPAYYLVSPSLIANRINRSAEGALALAA